MFSDSSHILVSINLYRFRAVEILLNRMSVKELPSWAVGVAQLSEGLPTRHEALGSISSTT